MRETYIRLPLTDLQFCVIVENMLQCPKCLRYLPRTTEYFRLGSKPDTFRACCRKCHSAAVCRRQKEKSEQINTYQQKWRKTDAGQQAARRRVLRRYGLTLEDYDALVTRQGGGCAICGGQPTRSYFDVDHDHYTQQVRGLLCHRCNIAIGTFSDNPDLITKALAYLTAPSPP